MLWESTPGVSATKPPEPRRSAGKPTLVLVVHTQCPCSVATLRNVLTLSAAELKALDITVVFTGPDANLQSQAPNVALAKSIPGAKITFCTEQEALQKYHAETSGQAFLYSRRGKFTFSGGLTAGRGEFGPSAGIDAIRSVLRDKSGPTWAPVYGCAVQTPHHDKPQR